MRRSERFRAVRLPHNPIIRRGMPGLAGESGGNINGPSLIRAPDWLPGRLGRYYLYFAHHGGQYIRLAWADELVGPWRVYEPGVLHVRDGRLLCRTDAEVTIDRQPADASAGIPVDKPVRIGPVGLVVNRI